MNNFYLLVLNGTKRMLLRGNFYKLIFRRNYGNTLTIRLTINRGFQILPTTSTLIPNERYAIRESNYANSMPYRATNGRGYRYNTLLQITRPLYQTIKYGGIRNHDQYVARSTNLNMAKTSNISNSAMFHMVRYHYANRTRRTRFNNTMRYLSTLKCGAHRQYRVSRRTTLTITLRSNFYTMLRSNGSTLTIRKRSLLMVLCLVLVRQYTTRTSTYITSGTVRLAMIYRHLIRRFLSNEDLTTVNLRGGNVTTLNTSTIYRDLPLLYTTNYAGRLRPVFTRTLNGNTTSTTTYTNSSDGFVSSAIRVRRFRGTSSVFCFSCSQAEFTALDYLSVSVILW